METKDVVTVSVSAGAALISGIFAWLSWLASRESRATAMGQAETSLRSQISITRRAVRDISIQIVTARDGKRDDELRAEDKRRLEPLGTAFHEAVEDNLNAYEDACAKYIDTKIDRDRFKKTYITEIRNICEEKNGPTSQFMFPEATSRYQCIWKVYKEWHHHEK